jgi:hypothetical protein
MTDAERVIQDLVANTARKFCKRFWTHFQKIVNFFSVCQQIFQALDSRRQRDRSRDGYFADVGKQCRVARKNMNKNSRPSLVRAV